MGKSIHHLLELHSVINVPFPHITVFKKLILKKSKKTSLLRIVVDKRQIPLGE